MKALLIGDITGKPGRDIVNRVLPEFIEKEKIDFVIANGENAAGGSGMTPDTCKELLSSGIDVLTTGDHIWKQRAVFDIIDTEERLLRPANYPKNVPGKGAGVYQTKQGIKIGVINLLGRVFMQPIDCPFLCVTRQIDLLKKETDIIFVDIHAEATSEKVAMGWYLDGIVTCVFGTHTHVQTADEKILEKGTAYITDVGMTGPFDSVIGRKKEQIIKRFLTSMPARFEVAENDVRLNAALVVVDEKTQKASKISRVELK